MSATPRMIRQYAPTGFFALVAVMLIEQRINLREPQPDPDAVTLGEMNRTVERMDKTLTALNQKFEDGVKPLSDRVSRLEFWRDAIAPVLVDHANAIRALQTAGSPDAK